jgi:hypothetical protein
MSYLGALLVIWLEPISLQSAALIAAGMAVRAGFDIGRKTLLESLGLELPAMLEEERTLWGQVTDFLPFNKPGPRLEEDMEEGPRLGNDRESRHVAPDRSCDRVGAASAETRLAEAR